MQLNRSHSILSSINPLYGCLVGMTENDFTQCCAAAVPLVCLLPKGIQAVSGQIEVPEQMVNAISPPAIHERLHTTKAHTLLLGCRS